MINNEQIILYLAQKGFESVMGQFEQPSLEMDDGMGNHDNAKAFYELEDRLWKYGLNVPRRDYGLLAY